MVSIVRTAQISLLLVLFFALQGFGLVSATRVIVLGIAQDGGIPHIGCTQKICLTERHSVSSIAMVSGTSVFIIDATPDLRTQHRELVRRFPELAKKNLFDGIFLTHAHMGHYTGLMFLGKESVASHNVPLYCSEEMASYLQKNAPWNLLVKNQNVKLHPFPPEQFLSVADFKIRPIPVPHRKEWTDTHGFLIQGAKRSLLYIPDIDSWEPVKDRIHALLKETDYALLDGTFYSGDELPGRDIRQVPHPTIQNSITFFKSLGVLKSQIYFIHLNHTNLLLDNTSAPAREFASTPYRIATEWQEFLL